MNSKDGLYDKFLVTRTDGGSAPGGRHEKCRYLVLDLDDDPEGQAAAWFYANAVTEKRPQFSRDLKTRLFKIATEEQR